MKEAGESKFTYKWTFPDGGTSTAKNPTHVFAGVVLAGLVTLIVRDSHGSQTRTRQHHHGAVATDVFANGRPSVPAAVRQCADGGTARSSRRGHPQAFGRARRGAHRRRRARSARCTCCSKARCGSRRPARRSRSVSEAGACVGEMSLLLGVPATADVVAERAVGRRGDRGRARDARSETGLPLALARLLAARLQVMTGYLADLKHQYADHEGGLGMVDVVLGSLMRSSGARSRARIRTRSRSRVLDRRERPAPRTPCERRPPRLARSSVSSSMHVGTGPIWRPALSTSVEPMRSIQAPSRRERRLVHVPAQHDVGLVPLDPARRARRRRSGACRSSSSATRRAVRGTPRSTAGRRRAPASSASCRSTTSRVRGPSHHGHTVTHVALGLETRAVDEHAGTRAPVEPQRGALAELVARVEVVIARARDDRGLGRHAREVLEHDRDLRVGLDDRRDVEQVAGDHDEVVVARDRRRPSRAASACSADRTPAGSASVDGRRATWGDDEDGGLDELE